MTSPSVIWIHVAVNRLTEDKSQSTLVNRDNHQPIFEVRHLTIHSTLLTKPWSVIPSYRPVDRELLSMNWSSDYCSTIHCLKAKYHSWLTCIIGQMNFDLRLITLDLSTQKLLFSDVLIPQHSIVIKQIIFYIK